jgi:methanogenic corrinoid protein MtbC1
MPKKQFTEEEARQRKITSQKEYAKRTSYQAQRKYNANTYTRLVVDIQKDKAELFKQKCKDKGIAYRQVFLNAVDKFIDEY